MHYANQIKLRYDFGKVLPSYRHAYNNIVLLIPNIRNEQLLGLAVAATQLIVKPLETFADARLQNYIVKIIADFFGEKERHSDGYIFQILIDGVTGHSPPECDRKITNIPWNHFLKNFGQWHNDISSPVGIANSDHHVADAVLSRFGFHYGHRIAQWHEKNQKFPREEIRRQIVAGIRIPNPVFSFAWTLI
jgi:hypothetical protein